MSIKSFAHLLDILAPRLEVDERQSSNSSGEEPISPCIMLMATLRYLSGGSYLDIHRTVDSDSEKEVVMADFRAISSGGVMNGCVAAWMDGCAESNLHQLEMLEMSELASTSVDITAVQVLTSKASVTPLSIYRGSTTMHEHFVTPEFQSFVNFQIWYVSYR
ncbi:hypothetical protein GQ600_4489 [Phytophthora cactorum]|nr:hypothetical protein GQ600_4489 [Phytophthora cactorum]